LNTTSRPNITPPGASHNEPLPSRPPRREEIPAATVRVMLAGGRRKADLLVVDLGEGPMVVKDFGSKSWWTRLLGRIQISREYRAYRWLGSMPGLPAMIGRVDRHALAIERIEGRMLAFVPEEERDGGALIAQLRTLLDRLYAKGLVHLDLRGRENLLLRSDGGLVVVDLAGALWFRPGGVAYRLLFNRLAVVSEAAFLKWKEMLVPGCLTPAEKLFLGRFRLFRPLWIFNPTRTKKPRD
jgi:hypothetical protein